MSKQNKTEFENLLRKVKTQSAGAQVPIQKVVPVEQEIPEQQTEPAPQENEEIARMTFRIDESLYREFQHLATEMYFKYNFLSDKQTFQYVFYNTIRNMEADFERKYGKLAEADEAHKAFYQKRQTKGTLLPPGIVMNKPKIIGIMSDEATKELYHKLMHNYFIHELEQQNIQRYSVSMFFYVVVNYLRENIDNMNIYKYNKF